MRKKLNTQSLLILLTLVGCNEKVSPNLQSSSATTSSSSSSSTTVVAPTTYYFGITNQSDTLLGYKLHKTGDGNYNTDCKISSTTALSNAKFTNVATQADNDISCYFEAEELSLYFNGLSFSYDASQSTCEYVGYSPYSYYDLMPGSSTTPGGYVKYVCSGSATNADVNTHATVTLGLALSTTAACNDYIDLNTGIATKTPRSGLTDDTELCSFNYTTINDTDIKCDEGEFNVTTYTVDVTGATTTVTPSTATKVKCGGKRQNCIQGALRQESTLISKGTRGTIITQPSLNTAFTSTIELPSPFSLNRGNKYYANFRRDLASSAGDFQSSWPPGGTNTTNNQNYMQAAYTDLFSSINVGNETFNPLVLERYSKNLKEDNLSTNPNITDVVWDAANISLGYTANSYAAEAYVGRYAGTQTSPAYTFYCFDAAMDIKARIRMYVRDWDRALPGTSTINTMEMISDIGTYVDAYTDTNAHQDIPGVYEIANDNDTYLIFNDREDWDDLIPMTRTEVGVADYYVPLRGWWNSNNFPGESLTD